ncbi:MAG: putative metal-binding motif-containing protein [Alphaproteobacteria bacterium]|nr:putative metal-binding motif-containing protein [Alphaproteobacteria bacterium]
MRVALLVLLLGACAQGTSKDTADTADGTVDSDPTGPGTQDGVTAITCFPDRDGDGAGAGEGYTATTPCPRRTPLEGAPWVRTGGDCDDRDATIFPGADELCNGLDDDCDGETDEALEGGTWYRDFDGDGFGADGTQGVQGCKPAAGWVDRAGDCWDLDPETHPGHADDCEAGDLQVDNDCDGTASEDGWQTFWQDVDGDGYGGKTALTARACSAPSGYRSTNTDCNDSDPDVNPGEWERCDTVDHDCNGSPKNGGIERQLWYDYDGDSWGTGTAILACSTRTGWVTRDGDCDDYASGTNPGATEICNDLDDDCNDGIDEGFAKSTWYRDADSDTWGTTATTKSTCRTSVSGYVKRSGDCDDSTSTRHPGLTEVVGNGIDEDCNPATGP